MFFICGFYVFLVIFAVVSIGNCDNYEYYHDSVFDDNNAYDDVNWNNNRVIKDNKNCWIRFNSKKHFEIMDKLDERYAEVRKEYQRVALEDRFDEQMLTAMLKSRGVAERELQKTVGDPGLIPAGLHLGGSCMMRMPKSVMFFHRMKLRNDTHFRVRSLRNDLQNMTLHAHLALNDLHLVGSYDRSVTEKERYIMYYTPTYGQVEFLLKNVQYKMEGRYRLLQDKLTIELIVSEINFDDVMMTYLNNVTSDSLQLQRKNIDDYLSRVKADLDKWLKDYFNDYLMYFGIVGKKANDRFQEYDKLKAIELNDYTDYVIDLLTQRIHEVKAESVTVPKFTIFAANGMELLLKDGDVKGLESMYRRSVATCNKALDIRKVDAVVGFSNLKVTYAYEAIIPGHNSTLKGVIILSADELTALMKMTIIKNSDSVDIRFEYLEQAKPESLTVEGEANRLISNFKYLLEQHVIAIMSNLIVHYVKKLGTLTRCVPRLYSHQGSNGFESSSENLVDNDYRSTKAYYPYESPNITDMDHSYNQGNIDSPSDNTKEEYPNNLNKEQSDNQENVQSEIDPPSGSAKEDKENIAIPTNVPKDKLILLQNHDAELEFPSDGEHHRHKLHLKYINNLTLTDMNLD